MKLEFYCWRIVEVLLVNLLIVMIYFLLIFLVLQSYFLFNSVLDSKFQGCFQSGFQLIYYFFFFFIYMFKLCQEFWLGKLFESEVVIYLDVGIFVVGIKFEGIRFSIGGVYNG